MQAGNKHFPLSPQYGLTRPISSEPAPEGLSFDARSALTFQSQSEIPFLQCLLFLQEVPPDVHYGEVMARKLTVYSVLTSFPFFFPTPKRVLFPIQDEGAFLLFCRLFMLILLPLILKHGLDLGDKIRLEAWSFCGIVAFPKLPQLFDQLRHTERFVHTGILSLIFQFHFRSYLLPVSFADTFKVMLE